MSDQQSIEKISVVIWAVHALSVGLAIALRERAQIVYMVGVPVSKVLYPGMLFLNGSEDALLVIAILKEADCCSLCVWFWFESFFWSC